MSAASPLGGRKRDLVEIPRDKQGRPRQKAGRCRRKLVATAS